MGGRAAGEPSARRRVLHAGLEPALGDGKQPCCLAGGERLVETEYAAVAAVALGAMDREGGAEAAAVGRVCRGRDDVLAHGDRKSTRLNSSHLVISYAVFCLKKK